MSASIYKCLYVYIKKRNQQIEWQSVKEAFTMD